MPKPLNDATKKEIVRLFDAGNTFAQISTKTRTALKNIESVLLEKKRIVKTTSGYAKPSVVAQRKRAAWLRAQGWSLERISVATGIPRETIRENWRAWAAKYDIELPEPATPPMPGANGPIITYRLDGDKLIREESKINPITGIEVPSERTTYDATDPVVAEYRRMIEEGAYTDEQF